jgi:MFS family permease
MRLTPAEIRAVIALAVGIFCVQVDFFALNLALPRMAVDLNETTTNMQWVVSAYMIAVGAAMIPGGRLVTCAVTGGSSWPAWLSSAGRHWSVACPPRTAC